MTLLSDASVTRDLSVSVKGLSLTTSGLQKLAAFRCVTSYEQLAKQAPSRHSVRFNAIAQQRMSRTSPRSQTRKLNDKRAAVEELLCRLSRKLLLYPISPMPSIASRQMPRHNGLTVHRVPSRIWNCGKESFSVFRQNCRELSFLSLGTKEDSFSESQPIEKADDINL